MVAVGVFVIVGVGVSAVPLTPPVDDSSVAVGVIVGSGVAVAVGVGVFVAVVVCVGVAVAVGVAVEVGSSTAPPTPPLCVSGV